MMLKIKRVHTPELRDEVYALRYRAYRKVGALDEIDTQLFRDGYDDQPNHILWALSEDDKVVGSIRTTWFDPEEPYSIPELDTYGDALSAFIPQPRRLLSGNRFVTDPERHERDSYYALILLRHYMLVAHVRAEHAIAAVRANHIPFYRRILRLNKISEGRQYPGLNSMMHLTASNFSENIDKVYQTTPILKPKGYERIFLDENYRDVWEIGLPVED